MLVVGRCGLGSDHFQGRRVDDLRVTTEALGDRRLWGGRRARARVVVVVVVVLPVVVAGLR